MARTIARLAALILKEHGEEFLDDDVHDAKATEASAINNNGPEAQIGYLGTDFVEELLKEEEGTVG